MSSTLKNLWRRIPDLNPVALLVGFTLADLVAVGLYGLYTRDILTSSFFHIARDRGFGEIVQYLKFGAMIAILARWRREAPSKLVTAWLILFTIMVFDDAIGIHEEVGGWLLTDPSVHVHGVRLKDLAEAVSFAALEGSAFLYIAFRHFQSPPARRVFSWWFAAALAPVIFSGLVLDIVRAPMVEQGGEIVAMTILLAAVLWRYRVRAPA